MIHLKCCYSKVMLRQIQTVSQSGLPFDLYLFVIGIITQTGVIKYYSWKGP